MCFLFYSQFLQLIIIGHIMNKDSNDILRLNFENFIWIVFITISVLNIIADNDEKKFINANNSVYKTEANNIFELTISIIFLIYIYFAFRITTL